MQVGAVRHVVAGSDRGTPCSGIHANKLSPTNCQQFVGEATMQVGAVRHIVAGSDRGTPCSGIHANKLSPTNC